MTICLFLITDATCGLYYANESPFEKKNSHREQLQLNCSDYHQRRCYHFPMEPKRPAICVTLTLAVMVVTCVVPCVGQTNNSVDDADGSIVWGELASDSAYKTVDYTADDGGLDPYYGLAVSFIDTSLPETLPVATVKDILDGKASIADTWQDLAKQFVGYALCVVIGFLFILIFPIVACCFCCCRCCGNCGGKRIQHQGPNDRCKRIGFAIALSILSLFVLTGAACVFVTSDQLHDNLDGLNDSFSEAVDDFNTFADNIDNQFRRLGDVNFGFLTDVLTDYVKNASSKLSEDIISTISSEVNLDTPLNELSALSSNALSEVTVLEGQVDTLETQRDTAVTDLSAISCGGCLDPSITTLNNMDSTLNTMRTEISTFKDEVSTDVFQEMKTELDDAIRKEVTDNTDSIDVEAKLTEIHNDQIKGMLDKVTDFKTTLNDEASNYQEQVDDWMDLIKPYDTYRWYAGVGLASLLGLVAVMMLLGVMLGACGSSVYDRPTERGAASNCGGLCLMASVGVVFIFGAVLMLLCTLMYMTGSLTERYVCQSIDHLDRLEEYAKSFDLGTDLSNYTFDVNGKTLTLSINDLMADCKEEKTLYTALGLKDVVDAALDEIDNYKTELSDINNINAGTAASATDGNVNASQAITDLQNTVTSIENVKTSVINLKSELTTARATADAAYLGAGASYDPMMDTLTAMEVTCDNLKITATNIKDKATDLNNIHLPAAIVKLDDPAYMSSLITTVTGEFVNTIFGFVDSYINDIKTKLEGDVARCTPFYSITNAILSEAVCHGIVDPLNGFWLALGWCLFFFMPSLILAVKLAKHYRTMLYDETYDSTTGTTPPPPYYTQASAPPKTSIFPPISGPNNKVAPF